MAIIAIGKRGGEGKPGNEYSGKGEANDRKPLKEIVRGGHLMEMQD